MLHSWGQNIVRWSLVSLSSLCCWACSELTPLQPRADEVETVYIGSHDQTFRALNAQTGLQKWMVSTDEVVQSLPATADGLVYVGSEYHFYAFNAKDGTKRWTFTTRPRASAPFKPVVSGQTIYLLGNNNNTLYALDAQTGAQKWSTTSATFARVGGWFSDPTVADGVVFVGGTDSTLYALNAQTGTIQWRFKGGYTFQSQPLVANGLVYAGCYNGKLYALDAATGKQKWEATVGGFVQSPRLMNQTIYVTNWGDLQALDAATGQRLWRYVPQINQNYTGNTGLITIGKGTIYGGFVPLDWNDGFIYSLDAVTGVPKKDLMPWPGGHSAPLSAAQVEDDILYVAGRDNILRALDVKTGTTKWLYKAGNYLTPSFGLATQSGKIVEPY